MYRFICFVLAFGLIFDVIIPATTDEPKECLTIVCGEPGDILRGFRSLASPLFKISEMEELCDTPPTGREPYTSDTTKKVEFSEIYGRDLTCDEDKNIMTGMELCVENGKVVKFSMVCRPVKDLNPAGKMTYYKPNPDSNAYECRLDHGITMVAFREDMDTTAITMDCTPISQGVYYDAADGAKPVIGGR